MPTPAPKPTSLPRFAQLADWLPITYYAVGDRVVNDSSIYRCTVPGLSDVAGGPTGNPPGPDNEVTWVWVQSSGVAWQSAHAYAVGARVTNAGGLYLCIVAGTSAGSGGPTGTGRAIVDGSGALVWRYIGTGLAVVGEPFEGQKDLGWLVGEKPAAQVLDWLLLVIYGWMVYLNDLAAQAWTWGNNHIFLGLVNFAGVVKFYAAPIFYSTAYLFGAETSTAANDLIPALAFTDHTATPGEPVNFKLAIDMGASATREAIYRTPRLADWQQNHAYTAGQRRTANGNNYECTVSGTSALAGDGPAGTGTAIVDNGATWKYVAPAGALVRVFNAQWLSDGAGGYHWVQYNSDLPSFKEEATEYGRASFYRAPGAGPWVDGSWIPTETFLSQTGNYATPGSVTGNTVVASLAVTAGTTLNAQDTRSSGTGGAGQSVAAGTIYKDTTVFAWAKATISGGVITLVRGANIASVTYVSPGVYLVTLQTAAANILCPVVVGMDNGGIGAYVDLGTPPSTTAFRVMLITTDGLSTPTDPANGGGFFVTVMQG